MWATKHCLTSICEAKQVATKQRENAYTQPGWAADLHQHLGVSSSRIWLIVLCIWKDSFAHWHLHYREINYNIRNIFLAVFDDEG